jgi:hypothetical protein
MSSDILSDVLAHHAELKKLYEKPLQFVAGRGLKKSNLLPDHNHYGTLYMIKGKTIIKFLTYYGAEHSKKISSTECEVVRCTDISILSYNRGDLWSMAGELISEKQLLNLDNSSVKCLKTALSIIETLSAVGFACYK